MSHPIRVVIVGSDTDSIADIARRIGRQENGATVDGIAVGFERGAELVHAKRPMVVFLDMCAHGIEPCIRWVEATLNKFPRTSVFAVCEDKSYETIRSFMRAGAAEYLLKPVSEIDLVSAFQKYRRLSMAPKRKEAEGAGGKIYSVFSAKSGVGVTTIAVNLAASIYKVTKEPTIIVDLDLVGGDVATFLDMRPDYTISDFARNIKRADMNLLQGIITRHKSGVYVLAEPHHVEEGVSISGDAVKKALTLLKTKYRHIVIDTEANLTQTAMAAVDTSDLILLTFVLNLPSIKNTQRYLSYLSKDTLRSNKIKLVVNRYLKKFEISVEKAEKILQRPILRCIPNDFNTAMESVNKGVLLGSHAPHSKLNLAIEALALSLTGKSGGSNAGIKTKASALNKVVGNIKLTKR